MPIEHTEEGTVLRAPRLSPRRRRRRHVAFLVAGLVVAVGNLIDDPSEWFLAVLQLVTVAGIVRLSSQTEQPVHPDLYVSAEGVSLGRPGPRITWSMVDRVEVRRRGRALRLLGVDGTIRLTDRAQADFARRAGTRPDAHVIVPSPYHLSVDRVADVLAFHANDRVRAQLGEARAAGALTG